MNQHKCYYASNLQVRGKIVFLRTNGTEFYRQSNSAKAAMLPYYLFAFLLMRFEASANGTVLQSEIVGSVKMRVYLTGMPELRLGLNDKVLFEGSGSKNL